MNFYVAGSQCCFQWLKSGSYMVKIAHRKENQWHNNWQKWVDLTIDLDFMSDSKKKSTFVLYPQKSGWMSHQMHVRYGKRDGIIAPTGEY